MKTIIAKTLATCVGFFLVVTPAVKADTLVYDNSTTNTLQNLTLVNTFTNGNEILLSGGAGTLTGFEFELFNPTNRLTGTVTMTVNLFANNGATVSGYPSPATSLFTDSFNLSLENGSPFYQAYGPYDGTAGYGLRVIESGLSLAVPGDLTLAISVSGLSGPDYLGLELYNSVTTGNAYNDYWYNNGSGWQLLQTGGVNNYNNFGGRFYVADVPEPSTICLGMVGGALLTFGLRQRRTVQTAGK